jgi:type IV pilus assembly protein PilN
MRVAGPRDRAVTLVRNLEHSRRFRAPRIVGETAQNQNPNGPNANLQPVSTNNTVNFDVLAEYNPLEPRETKGKADQGAPAAAGKPHHPRRAQKSAPRGTP